MKYSRFASKVDFFYEYISSLYQEFHINLFCNNEYTISFQRIKYLSDLICAENK